VEKGSSVGGEEMTRHSRPYLAYLSKSNGIFCGGALISPHAVLTAAHCLHNSTQWQQGLWEPIEWVEFNRHDSTDVHLVRMDLAEEDNVPHPLYDPTILNYDVALLFLPTEVTDIAPLLLNDDPDLPTDGEQLELAGWGSITPTEEDAFYPDVPYEVTVDYMTDEECAGELYLWTTAYGDWTFTDIMMCAFAPGKASCLGDSGEHFN
jgi:secreted trypsin-like serine protease